MNAQRTPKACKYCGAIPYVEPMDGEFTDWHVACSSENDCGAWEFGSDRIEAIVNWNRVYGKRDDESEAGHE